jgi:hypothetical protein
VLQISAGVLAMVSSLSMLAALVVSDVAGASSGPGTIEDDDPLEPHPVTIKKVDHRKQLEDEALVDQLLEQSMRFGHLEGY